MNEITLLASDLTRRYGSHTAVNGVGFELRQGEVLGFLGPNGAGKSTTMQMLTGNLAPSSGSIEICGIDLLERPKAAKALIGYLPETPPLYRDLSVHEFLTLSAKLHRVPRKQMSALVERAKLRCGLDQAGGKLIGSLSKGYQQRVGIAQAIVHNPRVVILDEPTVGLDPIQIREIRELIRELGGEHSVILSTHILPEVESICDRVQIMHQGQLVFSDSIDALRRYRQGNTLEVGLRHPPAPGELEAINGVSRVEAAEDGLWRLHFAPGGDPTDTLVALAAERRWGLFRLQPAQTSLEEVFVHLTRSEALV
ncbi:MAG: ABC transporter ATP-binding protein [Sulfuricellaceae bacterium]|nr:ABC transporter ATP-binding protein [Sulfuricellaceae bacterium]